MRRTVKLPRLGDGTDEATVVEWLVEIGATVESGTTLVVVELDKVDADVPSPIDGTLVEILVNEGDKVAVGAGICVIDG